MSHKNELKNLHIIDHPLVQHKLAELRATNTPSKIFRELLNEITLLLAYEATKNLTLSPKEISTPLETFDAQTIDQIPVIVPILRAGLGMVDGFLSLMPWAKVGHIGIYRDEITREPHPYYFKIPVQKKLGPYFICDPMLATSGSAIAAIDHLKKAGVHHISFVCVVSSPEGVKRVLEAHPDVPIYTASLDRELNQNGYILPGLGDAGDRLFGTK